MKTVQFQSTPFLALAAICASLAASDASVTTYSEIANGDLSNSFAMATTLQSGTYSMFVGQLNTDTDRSDYFYIDSLTPGTNITVVYSWFDVPPDDGPPINFPTLFVYRSDFVGGALIGTGILPPSVSERSEVITVPATGKILVVWEQVGPALNGTTNWSISIVPEPSSAACLALGTMLLIKRRRTPNAR